VNDDDKGSGLDPWERPPTKRERIKEIVCAALIVVILGALLLRSCT
jgi:hypothetical protein